MARYDHDERRLYLWVRVFGAVLFMVMLAFTVVGLVLLPLFRPDYRVEAATATAILGTLAASALALVGVQLRIWRNGKE